MSAAALSPAAALAWLESLSIDVRATAVLDARGAVLAGDAGLAHRAIALFEAGPRTAIEARRDEVLAVRSARHVVVAALVPTALERVSRADLRATLAALDGP